MRISDWSSDVCSSDLTACRRNPLACFDIGRSTAAFVPMGIIPDQSDRKCIVRLIQRLSAQKIPVAIIGVPHLRAARVDKVIKTIALRSEEHTSELQSLMRISYAVFCLKKKTISII